MRQLGAVLARAGPARRRGRRPLEVRGQPLERRPGRRRSRRPAAARAARGRGRAARRRAAARRPWRRSACRRRPRAGRPGSTVARAAAASPGERAKDESSGGCRGLVQRRQARAQARRGRPAPRPAARGANRSTSTPGRAEAGAVLAAPGRPSRSTGSPAGVARADEDPARARSRPATARSGRKRGCGLTVYSSALPWIFTAYGRAAEAAGENDRPHHEVVGERDVGPPRARRPRVPPPRWRRCSGRPPAADSSWNGRASNAFVAVGDVDRQEAADVRPVDRRAASARDESGPSSARTSQSRRRVDPFQR